MRWRIVAVVVALAILLAIPFSVGTYAVSTWSTALTFAVLAMSVNLLTGIAGLPTLGQAAYFGAGGYAAALVALNVSELGPVQLVAGGLVGAAFAAVTGPAAIRARGVAFLMITLAIGELAYVAAGQLTGITRGTDGISGIPAVVPLPGMAPLTNKGILYYYVLAVVVLVFIGIAVLLRSPFGASLRGLRDNEDRLRAVGYRTTAYAYGAYVIAGGIAGIGGSLLVTTERFIAPGDLGFDVAALALLARDRGRIPLAAQLLVYPMLDDRTVGRAELDNPGHRLWNQASNRFGWQAYLRDADPDVAVPARRTDLAGLPPAWVGVGTLDLFHDEDLAYAERLRAAGVPCEVEVVDGAFHGFDGVAPKADVSMSFFRSQCALLRTAFAPAASPETRVSPTQRS
mgnify:CR=1 FL=1